MIDDLRLQEKIGFKPHPKQEEVLKALTQEGNRETVIVAGVRFGKSALAGYIALRTLLEDNKKIWIVAPTYDLTGKVFEYVVKWFLKVAPSQSGGISYRPYPRIKTARGTILECKSADNPAGLLGEELDLLIVDEAAQVQRDVWDNYLFARMSSRKGKTVFISSPFGKNWFYEKYVQSKKENAGFHFTSKDGVSIDQSEWDRAKLKLPAHAFAQNYEAAFLEGAATVFRGIREIAKDTYEDPRQNHSYVIGVDIAQTNDFTVLTVIDTFNHKVVSWDRFNSLEYLIVKSRIIALARRYNNARVIFDTTGLGKPVAEDLRRDNIRIEDFKFSNKSKQELVSKLSLFIEQKGIEIPKEEVLIDELEAFAYSTTEHGNITYSAPNGLHDDCVYSLALAVWALVSPEKENPMRLVPKQTFNRSVYEYQ
jgi:hypothetical protein